MPFNALLVDDDSAILQTLKSVFETRDFNVSTAVSAFDAARSLARFSFDLVVTDMRMEHETAGFEVVRHAKSCSCRPVVIILSAYPIPVSEWRNAGADGMFMKGGGIFRILDDIELLLKSKQKSAAAEHE
ncbi:MAG TPA: response regulator [Candidatus Saccharimonadales bacterium]|nr:response regulator [Candidatus Saccharimonadales bacterium]